MKKILHLSTLLLLSWCLSLAGMQQAWASHAQAGQLSYSYVSTAANGDQTYLVKVEFYRDCSGIAAPTSFPLTATMSCGSTARTATLNQVGQPIIGSPYCASFQAQAACSLTGSSPSTALANFVVYTYQNTIVLPPAAEWILSVEESARPSVTNLSTGGNLRLEARLHSLLTPVGGGTPIVIHNDSPIFSLTNLPVPFVYLNQESTISFAAADPDRLNGPNNLADRLVYTLDRPLNGCNTYETYATYPTSGCTPTIDPKCSTRLLSCGNAAGANYSQNLPIAVASDTIRNGVCGSGLTTGTIQPRFRFNASQASFTFTPNRYLNTPSSSGDNKYVVVGKVDEYRTINGQEYLVGTSRRDFLVIVINGAGNTVPSNPTGTAGPPRSGVVLNITRDTTDLEIKTCNYSRVRFNFTDPDNTGPNPPTPRQNLTVFYPSNISTDLLQGGDIGSFVLSNNGTPNPSATFYFQPISSLAGTTILIPLRIEDDGCPAKGIQYRTIRVRIVNYKGATAVANISAPGLGNSAPNPAICAGGSLQINGAVDRPDSVRVATTGAVILQTYSYQWVPLNTNVPGRTLADAGLPTVTNTQNITVRPTVTTRYRLFISPIQGFGIGLCGDTTSVLVRVVPPPTVSIVASNTTVCSGSPVTLTATARRATDALTDVYTYRWTAPGGFTATGASITVNPTAATTYTVVATGAPAYGCSATATSAIAVAPAAVANFTKTAEISSRPGSLSLIPPVTFSFQYNGSLNPVTPGFQVDTVRWTYQLVRNVSGAAVTAPQVRFSNSRTTATTPPLQPGFYAIRLFVSTRAAGTNCPEGVLLQEVFVPDVVTPNIITPNGDNYNDFFVVNSTQRGGKLEIYNRWGTKVEEFSNYQNTWKADGQGPGVYYYYITDKGGAKTKGWIEVVK
ncbi:gliding motility-associated C-terminal domain-containing protein [Hymenobacter negativus]|uniref:Gliding motility-associated C-terminal domain-containing protein n=1 Tax=Hymenobacter negativus TaxID=2795026 RepID=A0ABS3QG03_9BACT|nr:gliding motility-associated C-terminal domain-containing protein [Hymenobacter negativus]MBO2010182.1 gliding motility-associated C-terminal domain-containing protein [Hymenobacter negativus]